jgi:hypothetical protein
VRAWSSFLLALASVVISCAACTRVELVNKADAYDAAIWDSNNWQILLNAVRASQRAPMSFVALGEVSASPNFSGTGAGTFNFIPSGLAGYSLNPSASYSGGFVTFQLSNLNQKEFAAAIRVPMNEGVMAHFVSEKWPEEIRQRILIQEIKLSAAESSSINRNVELKCVETDERTTELCGRIRADGQAGADWNCEPVRVASAGVSILNTAREFCPMNNFQIVLRKMRLVGYKKSRVSYRSAESILYYLGELIAAQNYSAQPYEPKVLLNAPDGHYHLMNLFVVKRGNPGAPLAAVQVNFNSEDFHIPRPQLGAIEEDRSLQVLDLAMTAIVLATSKESLPKSSNVTLITPR